MRIATPLLLGLLPLLVNCGGVDCSEEARSSVSVSTLDHLGNAVVPESMQYRVGDAGWTGCDCVAEDFVRCSEFVCGWEEAGRITVKGVWKGFEARQEIDVSLDEDGCHVLGQRIDLVFGP
jgi:hypothetical protein